MSERAKRTVITFPMRAHFVALWKEGKPLREIALALAVPFHVARGLKDRATRDGLILARDPGRPTKKQMTQAERDAFDVRVAELDDHGLTSSQIARQLASKRETVEMARDRNEARARQAQKQRTCLMCNKPFASAHAGNRRCDRCADRISAAGTGLDEQPARILPR